MTIDTAAASRCTRNRALSCCSICRKPCACATETGWRWKGVGFVVVRATPEPLIEIDAHSAATLMRIAWHLGNRHVPVQVLDRKLRIRADHVLADLVKQLGGHVAEIDAAFDPEAGAYAESHHHRDDH